MSREDLIQEIHKEASLKGAEDRRDWYHESGEYPNKKSGLDRPGWESMVVEDLEEFGIYSSREYNVSQFILSPEERRSVFRHYLDALFARNP